MAEPTRSADQLVNILLKNPEKLEEIRKDPAKELTKVAEEAIQSTPALPIPQSPLYLTVVGALGLVALAAVVGAIVLVASDKTAPGMLVALGSAAVGALAGLLAPTPKGK